MCRRRMHGYFLMSGVYLPFRRWKADRCIKVARSQMPTVEMTKREVSAKKLESKVAMPVKISLDGPKYVCLPD